MLPSNLSLNIEKTAGCNNKILVSNTDMKTGSNRNINRVEVYHKKFRLAASPEIHSMKSLDQPIIQTILPTDNQKMLAEKHNDEKLAITLLIMVIGLTNYHFW